MAYEHRYLQRAWRWWCIAGREPFNKVVMGGWGFVHTVWLVWEGLLPIIAGIERHSELRIARCVWYAIQHCK